MYQDNKIKKKLVLGEYF